MRRPICTLFRFCACQLAISVRVDGSTFCRPRCPLHFLPYNVSSCLARASLFPSEEVQLNPGIFFQRSPYLFFRVLHRRCVFILARRGAQLFNLMLTVFLMNWLDSLMCFRNRLSRLENSAERARRMAVFEGLEHSTRLKEERGEERGAKKIVRQEGRTRRDLEG